MQEALGLPDWVKVHRVKQGRESLLMQRVIGLYPPPAELSQEMRALPRHKRLRPSRVPWYGDSGAGHSAAGSRTLHMVGWLVDWRLINLV